MADWIKQASHRIPPPRTEGNTLEGWWFRGLLPLETQGGSATVGRFVRFIPAGTASGYVITLWNGKREECGEYLMVAVRDIWDMGWSLYPPTPDGSCPVEG